MRKLAVSLFLGAMAVMAISACQDQTEQRLETRWAGETMEEIIATLEDQIGGFDQTMMETNYRYNELFWAGNDENWGYAAYQLEEMLGSLEKGFLRRPEREASATQFVNLTSSQLMETIEKEDRDAFMKAFSTFAGSCNTCHGMEDVPFIQVIIPETRMSIVKL